MALSDAAIRRIRPGTKPIKITDEKGLYLLVTPSGGKWWRLDYRFIGKRKTLSMGVYPDIGLKEARDRRDEARRLVANGVDPGDLRKRNKAATLEKNANTFEMVAREWWSKQASGWSDTHLRNITQRMEKNIFPWIGARPIAEINAPELLTVLRRIEARGAAETAHRALENCGQIFRYGVATGRCDRNPAADLRGALVSAKSKNLPSVTDPVEVGALLRAIDGFKGTLNVSCALRLAPLLFVRPGELRKAEWSQFDLKGSEWRFVVSKTRTEHLVPLSRQAVEILKELHPLTGARKYVFPGRDPQKPMSEAAINAALRRMGYDTKTDITGHGFRAMARTLLHEKLDVKPEVIEHQLAHRVPDALGTAYNRTKFLDERRKMMQQWADYLDKLKDTKERS